MNVVETLEARFKARPDKPAIIFKEQTITLRQLKDSTFRLADSLTKLGLKKGDRVALYLQNSPEYIYSYLAAWSLGLVAVPLDFMLTDEELISCISHSEAAVLIINPKPTTSAETIKKNCPSLKDIILFLSLDSLIEKAEPAVPAVDIQDKDYACIFYTSGTTGKPKGVLCNYRQINAPAQAMDYFVNLGPKDIALCAGLPFSHLGGLVFIQAALFLNTTIVLLERFIPLEVLKNIQKYKVTCMWLVPSMYYAILQLKEFETFDLSSLNWVCSFGAPSSPEQLRRFHQYCPQAEFFHGWGMTETQGPSIVTSRGSNKIESVGKPAPWIKVKIFDENDQELLFGQIGEIVVKSWVVSDGYYKDPPATQEAFRSSWFHTGDLGRLDADADLYIVGRKKEMLKVGGEIVFEPEVEAAIFKHPDIAEVAVVGMPDSLRGEIPKAFVVLKEDRNLSKEDLRFFCRQYLAHFKIPHDFEFMGSLPKTRSGKVDKQKLRSG